MTDSVLIQNDRAHQIWRGTAKAGLPPMHRDLLAQVVETESGAVNEGDLWDGQEFSPPPPPDPKIAVLSALRNTDADMARVAEDIIGVLVAKGLITESDFPESVTEKLAARQALRAQLAALE